MMGSISTRSQGGEQSIRSERPFRDLSLDGTLLSACTKQHQGTQDIGRDGWSRRPDRGLEYTYKNKRAERRGVEAFRIHYLDFSNSAPPITRTIRKTVVSSTSQHQHKSVHNDQGDGDGARAGWDRSCAVKSLRYGRPSTSHRPDQPVPVSMRPFAFWVFYHNRGESVHVGGK
jgi:hypothetical protein